MPTYEYECMECKYRFEVFQSMKDEPVKKCRKCNGDVRRLFVPGAGIIFKGPGFYVTDYKKNDSQKEERSEQRNDKSSGKVESDSTSTSNTGEESFA